jgi:hypothetical protein
MNYFFLRKNIIQNDIICFSSYFETQFQAMHTMRGWGRANIGRFEYMNVMRACVKRIYGDDKKGFLSGRKWPLPWPA